MGFVSSLLLCRHQLCRSLSRRYFGLLDDKFVDEIRQSISACKVFLLIPIFNLCASFTRF